MAAFPRSSPWSHCTGFCASALARLPVPPPMACPVPCMGLAGLGCLNGLACRRTLQVAACASCSRTLKCTKKNFKILNLQNFKFRCFHLRCLTNIWDNFWELSYKLRELLQNLRLYVMFVNCLEN